MLNIFLNEILPVKYVKTAQRQYLVSCCGLIDFHRLLSVHSLVTVLHSSYYRHHSKHDLINELQKYTHNSKG